MTTNKNLTIFYSWQSDLPFETNQRGISLCAENALLKLKEKEDHLIISLDEATRNETGSPDIPQTIFNKITNSDIFICDITTIDRDTLKRKTPNPNVLVELGYAIAELGWERIVLLFNKEFGDFQNDLPFDLDKRRVVAFSIKDKLDKNGKGDLTNKLITQIESIIAKNPSRPTQKKSKSKHEIQREKDIKNLISIFSYVHIKTIEKHIDNLPYNIHFDIFFFEESIKEIYNSNSFYLYDQEAKSMLKKFVDSLSKTLVYMDYFSNATIANNVKFYIPMDVFPTKAAEKAFNQLIFDRETLNTEFGKLIEFIRENYIEIDVDELSKIAYKNLKDIET